MTYQYRKQPYQEFKTEELNLSALIALRDATHETEPEKSKEIDTAIKNGEYKKATNVVYFHPPFEYHEELFEQLYIYQQGETFRRFLMTFLEALKASPHKAAYTRAIRRITVRLKGLAAEGTEEKPSKVRKKRQRAKAQTLKEGAETKRAAAEPPAAVAPPYTTADIEILEGDLPVLDPEGREEFYRLLAQMPSAISGL